MKRIIFFAALAAIALSACQQELNIDENKPKASTVFTATTESPTTKTVLSQNGENYDVLWQNEDQITIVDAAANVGVYQTASTTTQGSFSYVSGTAASTPDYKAWYPATLYNAGTPTLPATQEYTAGNIKNSPMYAESSTENLSFKNICGIIRLNVSTTQVGKKVRRIILSADQGMSGAISNAATLTGDSYIATVSSTDGVTLDCGESGVAIGTEATAFHFAVPQNTYTGLSITVQTTDGFSQTRTLKSDKSIVVGRSSIADVTISFNNFATDLSALASANCYIVPAAGDYKFRATVKGNGAANLGGVSKDTDAASIASAELVWATFNTTVAPVAGELIKDIRYADGYVYFSTGDVYKEGNALVAVKGGSGNILWSWHLWFESDNLAEQAQTYPGSGYVVMDRNLGALTNCYAADNALDFGFAYQNGRKDPFMMSATRTSYTALGVLGTYTSAAGSSNLASSILRPTVVFGTDSWGGSPDYWTASDKTIFDPCPPGWKVGPSDLWSASGFNSTTFVPKDGEWGTYHGCVFNGEAWFPATGDRWGSNHNNTGSLIRVWARGAGNALASGNGGSPTLGDGSNPGHGYSVRCVRE